MVNIKQFQLTIRIHNCYHATDYIAMKFLFNSLSCSICRSFLGKWRDYILSVEFLCYIYSRINRYILKLPSILKQGTFMVILYKKIEAMSYRPCKETDMV